MVMTPMAHVTLYTWTGINNRVFSTKDRIVFVVNTRLMSLDRLFQVYNMVIKNVHVREDGAWQRPPR
jgi:hypothetical protein